MVVALNRVAVHGRHMSAAFGQIKRQTADACAHIENALSRAVRHMVGEPGIFVRATDRSRKEADRLAAETDQFLQAFGIAENIAPIASS